MNMYSFKRVPTGFVYEEVPQGKWSYGKLFFWAYAVGRGEIEWFGGHKGARRITFTRNNFGDSLRDEQLCHSEAKQIIGLRFTVIREIDSGELFAHDVSIIQNQSDLPVVTPEKNYLSRVRAYLERKEFPLQIIRKTET